MVITPLWSLYDNIHCSNLRPVDRRVGDVLRLHHRAA
jgi:hypothetical protein